MILNLGITDMYTGLMYPCTTLVRHDTTLVNVLEMPKYMSHFFYLYFFYLDTL